MLQNDPTKWEIYKKLSEHNYQQSLIEISNIAKGKFLIFSQTPKGKNLIKNYMKYILGNEGFILIAIGFIYLMITLLSYSTIFAITLISIGNSLLTLRLFKYLMLNGIVEI